MSEKPISPGRDNMSREQHARRVAWRLGGPAPAIEPVPTTQCAEKKQPTTAGYWWTRPDSGCLWRVVEISIHGGTTYIEEMGEEGQDLLPACPWWEWVGPIAPPPK